MYPANDWTPKTLYAVLSAYLIISGFAWLSDIVGAC